MMRGGRFIQTVFFSPAVTSANPEKRQAFAPAWLYAVAVALLPLLVLWHRDDVLYSPPLHTDPWFYLGYFRSLPDFKRDFAPGFHGGSRYSWILPGYIVHSIFSPVAANLILHLTVHSVAVLSLFAILRNTIGLRSAFLTAMLFSLHPWLWAATGWDYVDGAGIAYWLLTLALLNRSVLSPKPTALVLAGMALALTLFTNLFLITTTPLLLLYFFATAWLRRGALDKRAMLVAVSWLALGFGAVTLLFCAITYRLDGTFWFLSPALATARNYAANWRWPASIWEDGRLEPWLWFGVAAALAALLLLPQRVKRGSLAQDKTAFLFSIQFALALSAMAYLQHRGPAVLGQYFYASYLLPFTFLVIGSSFWQRADAMGHRAFLAISGGECLLLGAIWYQPEKWPFPEQTAIMAATITLAMALLLRHYKIGVLLSAAGFVLLTGAMGNRAVRLHGSRAQYERVMNMRAKIEGRRDGNLVRFWFDERDPNEPDYIALNSTYFAEFSRLGLHFPQYGCESRVEAGTLVVVSSSNEHPVEAASGPLANCWRPFGMKPISEEVDRYRPSCRPPYTVALIRAQADPLRRHSLLPVFDSDGNGVLTLARNWASAFPLERWNLLRNPSGQGQMRVTARGIEVQTPRAPYATALTYAPLIASVTGRYRFAIEYTDQSGQFAFGARPADDSRYLAEIAYGHHRGKVREMAFWIDLKKGDKILLRIANNNNDGPGSASFRMQKLSTFEIDPVPGAPPLASQ